MADADVAFTAGELLKLDARLAEALDTGEEPLAVIVSFHGDPPPNAELLPLGVGRLGEMPAVGKVTRQALKTLVARSDVRLVSLLGTSYLR